MEITQLQKFALLNRNAKPNKSNDEQILLFNVNKSNLFKDKYKFIQNILWNDRNINLFKIFCGMIRS